jgi:lipase chaperone LimK
VRRRVRPRLLGSAVFAAALLAGWLAWRDGSPPDASARRSAAVAAPARATQPVDPERAAPDASRAAGDVAPLHALHSRLQRSSLRGVQPDGELSFDAAGRLRADAGLRRMFDHFLSLTGEFTEAEIAALLLDHVRQRSGEDAAAQAAETFERYLALRHELAATSLSEDLTERLAQLQAARRRWFGAEADAMFGAEEADIAHTLARQSLLQDPELSDAERAASLAQLEAQRPAGAREAERGATAAVLAEEQTRQFDALGLDAAARDAERRALWGPEAAQRLAALDAERAAWQRRITDYAAARDQMLADPRLSVADRERALVTLRAARFDAQERLRIEALDAIGALPGG